MKAKKILSIALAAAMTASLGAVASFAEEAESNAGVNATKYEIKSYSNIIGEDSYGALCGYEGNKKFDDSIDTLKAKSNKGETTDATSVAVGDADNYIIEWKGTMTAAEAGEYTLIGRKIDNGFVMKVDGEKVYEYWGASHWFDGGEDRLVGETSFEVGSDPVDVEIYFLELGGGDGLEMFATTTPSDTNSGANINDVFTFDLKQTTYSLPSFGAIIPAGVGTDGNNGAQCVTENFKFDETIDALMAAVSEVETYTAASFNEGKNGGDDYIVKYTGTMTPATSGTYTFGATKMDNGFVLFIETEEEDVKVYEMWANEIWNDNGSNNAYPESIDLEAGKAYQFVAYYLELGGGEGLDLTVAIDDADAIAIDEAFTFTTDYTAKTPDNGSTDNGNTDNGNTDNGNTDNGNTDNGNTDNGNTDNGNTNNGNTNNGNTNNDKPAKTGDATLVAVAVAVVALAGAAVVSKKRHTAE